MLDEYEKLMKTGKLSVNILISHITKLIYLTSLTSLILL